MAEKTEKKTNSEKLNGFLSKNRKLLLIVLILALAGLIGYVIYDTVANKAAEKNIAKLDAITSELTTSTGVLTEEDLKAKIDETLNALAIYTKKAGVSGVRANMLAAELNYDKKDYQAAIENWKAAVSKGKRSYTAPIANYQIGVCYEQLNDLANAADAYKTAAETENFPLASHALFSYGRVLEAQGEYAKAVEAYQMLCDAFAKDEWASIAKSRILYLQTKGKVE